MSQSDFIRDIAKYGLENDQEKLLIALSELIEYSKKTKKTNFALQLQSILKDTIRQQQVSTLSIVGSAKHILREEDKEVNEFIIEKITSDYRFNNLITASDVTQDLKYFIEEHQRIELLRSFDLPVANKILLHGPSGCGKTLASYVIAGELNKMMYVVNLGAIVSSKLGETSKNLAKIFRRAASEDCVIFIDEFDSLGKVRDYSQDHGEMKRVVNTILQLFDYLPQSSIVIAATNQKEMLDDALLRRFDLSIQFGLPNLKQIDSLITLTLKNGKFDFSNKTAAKNVIKSCVGLSYYSIQKTLITAIKRSLFSSKVKNNTIPLTAKINTDVWAELIEAEKKSLNVKKK
ncbi:MAG TPA: ATP-binding protein [Bacteroidia bacterium]|jgi:AAA+ superfamily predicted ATPase